jgi:hypothetical protein
MRFHAKLELHGKTATGIQVPSEVVEELNSGKRPPVRVTMNGYSYASTIAPMGGVFLLPVSAENRKLIGIEAGDEVDVEVELDAAPRELTIPSDLEDALNNDTDARRFFDTLSRSARQRIVLSVDGAKTAETRQRRITKAISDLHDGHS